MRENEGRISSLMLQISYQFLTNNVIVSLILSKQPLLDSRVGRRGMFSELILE